MAMTNEDMKQVLLYNYENTLKVISTDRRISRLSPTQIMFRIDRMEGMISYADQTGIITYQEYTTMFHKLHEYNPK